MTNQAPSPMTPAMTPPTASKPGSLLSLIVGPADVLANLGMTNPWNAAPQTQWNVEGTEGQPVDTLANLGMINPWGAGPQKQWNVPR